MHRLATEEPLSLQEIDYLKSRVKSGHRYLITSFIVTLIGMVSAAHLMIQLALMGLPWMGLAVVSGAAALWYVMVFKDVKESRAQLRRNKAQLALE